MTVQTWLALGFWLGAVVVQTLNLIFDGRLKRIEKVVDQMHAKASEDGNRQQRFVNDVETRLARMDEQIKAVTRLRGRN